jgi:hypothetical protein
MIDFFTIVCVKDYHFWTLQARSFARFVPNDIIGKICVAVNEDDPANSALVHAHVRAHLGDYGPHVSKVHALDRVAFFDRIPNTTGWRAQQAIKIRSYRAMSAGQAVILDAKNHFIRPITRGDFLAPDGRPLTRLRMRPPTHPQYKWLVSSLKLLGLDPALADQPSPPTTTPYPLQVQTLAELDALLSERHGGVETIFESRELAASEFLLIYAYVLLRHGDPLRYYSPGLPDAVTLFNRWPEENDALRALVAAAEAGLAPFFAVHHGRKGRLDQDISNRIADFWHRLGLADREEAAAILG